MIARLFRIQSSEKGVSNRMRVSLEKQIQVLQECGIELLPEITIEHLLASYNRDDYENEPYLHLLIAMGGEQEEEPYGALSANIWHLDTECIEDHGAYAAIAHRMRGLAGDALKLEEINDYVDVVEEGEAWLSFKLNGKQIRWEPNVQDDWVDAKIFNQFANLLAQQPTDKRFTYLDLGGQDCLIGCATPAQMEKLKRETGLDFQWLS